MKPAPGQCRVIFNLPEDVWVLMKEQIMKTDLPHANWLRAAVREKLARDAEQDGF
jgi:hypothetical protein